MNSDGIRQLIVIPQTQYQQLVQNQKKIAMTTPTKGGDAGDTDVQTDQRNESRDSLCQSDINRESDIIYSGAEPNNLDDIHGKILQLIHCSYPKVTVKKNEKTFLLHHSFRK